MTAQFVSLFTSLLDVDNVIDPVQEHTILLRPTRKEVVSRGDDY